jgi:integrase
MVEFTGRPMKDLKGYLPTSKLKLLLKNAKTFRDYILLRLLIVTGARISEIVGDKSWYKNRVYEPARVEDINFEEGVIYLWLLKRKKYPPSQHRVTLDKSTLQKLKQYIFQEKLKPKDALFPITRQRVFQIIRQTAKESGIEKVGRKKIHPHHLRHSHCIKFMRKKNTIEQLVKLKNRIGHASINTTAQYLQFGEETKEETQEVFGDL